MLDDDLGRRLDSFFGRVRDWPVTRVSVSPDLATSVASGLRRVRQRRRLVASGVVAILVAAVALTAAFVAPHRAGAPAVVEPDGTGRPAPSGPVSPSAPVLPSTLVSPSAVDAAHCSDVGAGVSRSGGADSGAIAGRPEFRGERTRECT